MSADLPGRPLLAGLYHAVRLDDQRVQVSNAGRHVVLSGEGFGDEVTEFLGALDGNATLDELASRFPRFVPSLLQGLVGKGLVVDGSPQDCRVGAAPGAVALGLPDAGCSPAEAARTLSAATVAVLGCGPVGGALAVLLAKAGVGRLLLADAGWAGDAAVSPVLAAAGTGIPLTQTVADLCARAGASMVEVVGGWPQVPSLADTNLAVVEISPAGYEDAAGPADACLQTGVPFLVHGQDALEAAVGPLVVQGGSPCHRCADTRQLSHVAHLDAQLSYRRHRATAAPRADAFLAAHASLVAGVLAVRSLSALLGVAASGQVKVIDLSRLSIRDEQVLPVPGCRSCAEAAGRRPGESAT